MISSETEMRNWITNQPNKKCNKENSNHDKTKFEAPFITNPECSKIHFFST